MTPSKIVSEDTLVQQRQQGLTLLTPLKQSVLDLDVKTAADYTSADSLLSRIRGAKASWLGRINPVIEPIRAGLDLLYGLRKDIVDPLDNLEVQVKSAMAEFKKQEAKQLRAAQEERERQEAELLAAALQKEERESQAKTKQLREKLQQQRAELEQKLATSKATESPAPIKVAGSSVRTTKKWRVISIAHLAHHILGRDGNVSIDPELMSLLTIDTAQMDAYFKLCKPPVGMWLPGVEVYEDVTIAGRR